MDMCCLCILVFAVHYLRFDIIHSTQQCPTLQELNIPCQAVFLSGGGKLTSGEHLCHRLHVQLHNKTSKVLLFELMTK